MIEVADYIIDYNALASEGKLTKLVGRATELERVVQILLRYNKNNPVLTGLAGVGKKTLVYGFASLLAEGKVPDELKDYKLVEINVSALLIDSISSEEYEENVKRVFAYLRSGKYIIFVKDTGLIVRKDVDDGTKEIAKYLKPKLLAGECKVILAVDTISFKGQIENDAELMAIMQVIRLDECTVKEALSITTGAKSRMEKHYRVKIDDDAIEAAVVLTNRYVKNRLFPEKSIDLTDDACSLVLMDIADGKTNERRVTKVHMERTIGIWTGIPMDKVQEEDKERLAKMDDYLRQRVIGQDEAVKAVSDAFRRSKSGLQDPNRPLGTFLFIGTTGVGKTELAKSLAEFVFYDETCLIRIDMSEFMDKASIVRLVGPPAGSPGYEQGGLLTEAIRNKPYQLILFDEIEKAHPEVMNLMLQLLDEGRLTDSRGVTVDFRNTIVILTSNIGHDVPSYKRISVLTKYLRPELVNRIDDIVSFNQLVENDMLKIVELNLRKLTKKAKAAQNLTLDITVYAKRWFVDELFTSKMGVRALKRLIQHEVENVMAIQIMNNQIQYGDTVIIDSPDRTKLLIYSKEHGSPDVIAAEIKTDEKKEEKQNNKKETETVKKNEETASADAVSPKKKTEGEKEKDSETKKDEATVVPAENTEIEEKNINPAKEDAENKNTVSTEKIEASVNEVLPDKEDNTAGNENAPEGNIDDDSKILEKEKIKEGDNDISVSGNNVSQSEDAKAEQDNINEIIGDVGETQTEDVKAEDDIPVARQTYGNIHQQTFNPAIAAAIAKARQATARKKPSDNQ